VKVTWSPLANDQVDDAIAYIAADDPTAAVHWLERLLERVTSLSTYPDSGWVRQGVRAGAQQRCDILCLQRAQLNARTSGEHKPVAAM